MPFRACLFAPAFSRLPFRALIVSLLCFWPVRPSTRPHSLPGTRISRAHSSLPFAGTHAAASGSAPKTRAFGDSILPLPKTSNTPISPPKDGLGDDNAYALTCDKAGRVWVGTLNHGVSVFNGKQWKTYGPLDGPLGSRLFALAVNPPDGGVWGATEAGLFRYRPALDVLHPR